MQKVTFINARHETIEINPYNPPYVFESIKGIDAINTSIVVHTPAGMDGAIYQDIFLDDREITLTLHIHGKDPADMYKKKQELIRLTGSGYYKNGVLGRLWYENDYGRWWIPAIVKQGAKQLGKRLKNYLTMQVVFYCPDSAFRAEEATIDKMAYIGGGFKFPLKIPAINQLNPGVKFGLSGYLLSIYNDGDQDAPLELEITGTAQRPKIENKKTGEFLAVNRELAAGDRLIINTEPGAKRAEIVRSTGETEDAMGYIDPDSTWFSLQTGYNTLEYTSGDDGTDAKVIIATWSRYGGV
ncbi:MAG: phage tail family protein [Saccharofermentanales bacterium]|jgi:hypothetical protein